MSVPVSASAVPRNCWLQQVLSPELQIAESIRLRLPTPGIRATLHGHTPSSAAITLRPARAVIGPPRLPLEERHRASFLTNDMLHRRGFGLQAPSRRPSPDVAFHSCYPRESVGTRPPPPSSFAPLGLRSQGNPPPLDRILSGCPPPRGGAAAVAAVAAHPALTPLLDQDIRGGVHHTLITAPFRPLPLACLVPNSRLPNNTPTRNRRAVLGASDMSRSSTAQKRRRSSELGAPTHGTAPVVTPTFGFLWTRLITKPRTVVLVRMEPCYGDDIVRDDPISP
ncbi:hypothetical protein CSOJ01_00702 [Colletotrichum sojae]|uniref:Uncharacterized protein n=1 Tax=Colletotrichum sojae TaxID=2175907 RepID=A0A8H6JX46_9PEZI|nr:hypothetical protein CSOJ01_00702 [Colletotrichum sojae]